MDLIILQIQILIVMVINSNSGYLNVACNSDSSTTDGCQSSSIYCPKSSVLVTELDTDLYCDILCGTTDSCINLMLEFLL